MTVLVQERFPTLSSIDAITRNAHRLNRLVANLLHYSRVQGMRDTVRRAVDLVELCEASVELLAIRASQKGVDLRFDTPGQPIVVFGDALVPPPHCSRRIVCSSSGPRSSAFLRRRMVDISASVRDSGR